MSGIKVKIVVEPGDAKADLKIKHTPGDGEVEERIVPVGGSPTESSSEFELQAASQLHILVEHVRRVQYDPERMMNVEVEEEATDPQKAEPKSGKAAVHATGAKESNATEAPKRK